MFFKNYIPQRNHCFLEISHFSAKRTTRFVPNVAYVWCGYEYKLEKQMVSKDHRQGFVMVGRLLPHKRPDFLIDAWVKTNQPLDIIGSCQDKSFLERLNEKIGEKPIKIHLDISNSRRDRIISESLGLIAPSSNKPEQSELLGLIIFEALQNGTIPIVSSIPSYIEIMKALGLMDWVFECNSVASLRNVCSSLEVLSNQDYCSLVESARTKARNQFKWDNIVPVITKK
jgi:glycosyltransferase involved in cell wall biosynthesis